MSNLAQSSNKKASIKVSQGTLWSKGSQDVEERSLYKARRKVNDLKKSHNTTLCESEKSDCSMQQPLEQKGSPGLSGLGSKKVSEIHLDSKKEGSQGSKEGISRKRKLEDFLNDNEDLKEHYEKLFSSKKMFRRNDGTYVVKNCPSKSTPGTNSPKLAPAPSSQTIVEEVAKLAVEFNERVQI